jgi:hypothetical protein
MTVRLVTPGAAVSDYPVQVRSVCRSKSETERERRTLADRFT